MQSIFRRSASSAAEAIAAPNSISKPLSGTSNTNNVDNQESAGGNVTVAPPEFRFIYPEFLPDPDMTRRNKLREKLERIDMLQRRSAVDIPEFYTGVLK